VDPQDARIRDTAAISADLKLIDQFRIFALLSMQRRPDPPSETVEQAPDGDMELKRHGVVVARMPAAQMDDWTRVQYEALRERVYGNWVKFNQLFAQEPRLSAEERANTKVEMDSVKEDLCTDFREMVRIHERTLGAGLPDHYQLFEVCNGQ
jgi:hypothetical protein